MVKTDQINFFPENNIQQILIKRGREIYWSLSCIFNVCDQMCTVPGKAKAFYGFVTASVLFPIAQTLDEFLVPTTVFIFQD